LSQKIFTVFLMQDPKLKSLNVVTATLQIGAESRNTVEPFTKPILHEMSQQKKMKKRQKKSTCGFCKQCSHKTRSCRYFKRKQKEELNKKKSTQDVFVEEMNVLKRIMSMCITQFESLEKKFDQNFGLIFQLLKDIQSEKKNEKIQQKDLQIQMVKDMKNVEEEKEKQTRIQEEEKKQQKIKAQKEVEEKIQAQKKEQERIEDRKERIWNEMIQCWNWTEIIRNVMRDDDEGEKMVWDMKEDWEQRIKEKQKKKQNKKYYR